MTTELRQTAKNEFEKDFLKLMNNAFLERQCKIWENIEILNLSQPKEEETILCQNQIIIQIFFYRKSFCNRNEKDPNNLE